MSDPFRRLKQKENRDKRKAKIREMGVSGRGVKLLNKLTNQRSIDARKREEARRAKEWQPTDD